MSSAVRYQLVDVDIDCGAADMELTAGDAGVALTARRDGRPLAFVMHPAPGPRRLTGDELGGLVAPHVALAAIEDAALGELGPPSPSQASITVAVCTHDRPELLRRCLEAIVALGDRGPGLEVLVVDNAPSGPGAAAVARELGARHSVEPVPGLDVARNRALREARGEIVAFIDDDAVVDAGWLAGLRAALAVDPGAVAVTGLVLPLELETEAQVIFERRGGFRKGFDRIRFQGSSLPGNPLFPCGAGMLGVGCNMALRRDAILAMGGFDEALDTGPPLPAGGDLDIFYRVIRSGAALVYEPRMVVFHQHRRDLEGLRRQYRSWGEGAMAVAAKGIVSDRALRGRHLRFVGWWLREQVLDVSRAARGRGDRPLGMALAELAGGVLGLTGSYARSRRRMRRRGAPGL